MPKISKIMDSNTPTLKKEARVSDAATLMANNTQGCVVIVEEKKAIGIITESDIVRNLVSKKVDSNEKVTEIMSSPPTTISHNSKLEKANKIIDTKHFRRYPVIKNGALVGVITENGIVHAINDNIGFHRNVQNAVLIIFVIFEIFIFVLYRHLVDFLPFLR